QRLHKQHGLPPRFRQRLLHEENTLDDAVTLASVMERHAVHEDTTLSDAVTPDAVIHLQVLVLEFSEAGDVQRSGLGEAAEHAMLDEVESLLQLPMDPDAVTGEPNHTPLMVASGNGHVDVVRLLLEAGAEMEALAADGSTALMWAALEGHDSVVRLLLEARAEMDVRDRGGWT
ncbi:Ehmt1, partial [Symbiodinium sp. CCMP2456]